MPGEGGVRCACQSIVAPMISGSRLKGKPTPGMPKKGIKPKAGMTNSVSVCDKSGIHRKLAPRSSMAL